MRNGEGGEVAEAGEREASGPGDDGVEEEGAAAVAKAGADTAADGVVGMVEGPASDPAASTPGGASGRGARERIAANDLAGTPDEIQSLMAVASYSIGDRRRQFDAYAAVRRKAIRAENTSCLSKLVVADPTVGCTRNAWPRRWRRMSRSPSFFVLRFSIPLIFCLDDVECYFYASPCAISLQSHLL